MADPPNRQDFKTKRDELFKRLLGEPTDQELARLQLHIDVLEKWNLLTPENHHDDQGIDHQHHDHSG